MEVVDFLGRGWTYPLAVQRGSLRSSGGEDSIRESIILILSTARGERVMRPDFGCRLNEPGVLAQYHEYRNLAAKLH